LENIIKKNKLIGLLTLYIDDILITDEDYEIKNIIKKLKSKYTISKESDVRKIIEINIYKTKDGYKINQEDYINKIINNYNMNKTKIIKYPCRKISNKERKKCKTCRCWKIQITFRFTIIYCNKI